MPEEIKNVKLSFACSENWDEMPDAKGGKHCDKCQKKVYDFTNCKADEFIKVLAENNYSICGRFSALQIATTPIELSLWKRWLSAAMLLVGINLVGNKVVAQHTKHKNTKQKVQFPPPVLTMGDVQNTKLKQDTSTAYFGMVNEVMPSFPGGEEKLYAFINNNIDHTKALKPGRVNVTFVVEKDGTLTDVKAIGRLYDEGATTEALRVMKLSPRWIPGKQNGKPVRVQYMAPIIFK